MLLTLSLLLLLAAAFYELNLQILNLHALEKWFRGTPASSDTQQRYSYQKALQLQAMCRSSLGSALLLIFLAVRLGPWLYLQLENNIGAYPLLLDIAFVVVLQLTQFAFRLPWNLYRRFIIEERFGFNCMKPKDYAKDLLKAAILSLLLGLPVLLGLFFLMQNLRWWWLWGFLGLTACQVLLLWLYPIFIAPLFNRFRPLTEAGAEGRVKQQLEQLLQQCHFAAKGLFVMDGSKRSRHSNAYFTGFGRNRRIVLFDTLLDELNPEQLAAVLAHEIGHCQKKHIPKMLLQSLLGLFLGFIGLYFLAQWSELFRSFGFSFNPGLNPGTGPSPAVLLFVGLILASPLNLAWQRLSSHFSRKHEFEADAYAVAAMKGSQALGRSAANPPPRKPEQPGPPSRLCGPLLQSPGSSRTPAGAQYLPEESHCESLAQ